MRENPSMHTVKQEIMFTEAMYPFANYNKIKMVFISSQILCQNV